jgi:DNA-binding Lrp family transcriptional regulator
VISAIARDTDLPESTVRRRLTRMFTDGRRSTHVEVDPQRLGLRVDANLRLHVTPGSLDSIGRTLARRARG